MRVRLRRCGLLRRRHLGAQALQLLVERGLVGQQRRELLVALAQARFELLQLLGGLPAAPASAFGSALASKARPGAGRAARP